MKASNFELKKSRHEKSIEETMTLLESLAIDILDYSPETPEFSQLKETFITIQPTLERELSKYIEETTTADFCFEIDKKFEFYFELIDKLNLVNEFNQELTYRLFMVSDTIDHTIARDILRKRQLYTSQETPITKDHRLADYILKKLNFSEYEIIKIIQSWLTIEDDDMTDWFIYKNLKNIRALEQSQKDSVKYLFDNFGIRGFGRYSIQELKKQYLDKDSMHPYGLYFQAVMDWNGSFSYSNQSEKIRDQVEDNSFMLRIIEADGKIDLAKRLLFLRDKYHQKIKFMYMHVHGNTDVIGLGDKEGDNRKFTQEDLKGKGVQRIKELFENDAELIMSSCLTGTKGGLAEEMSHVYGIKVIASDKVTEGEPIAVTIKKNATGNNLEFNIVFNTVDQDNTPPNKLTKGTVVYGLNK